MPGARLANGGHPPASVTIDGKEIPNPRQNDAPGTMLGASQKAWWKETLKASDRTWKFWISGVPVAGLAFDFDAIPWKSVPRVVLSADAWTGYPGERAEMLSYLRDNGVENVVVLSGDMHTQLAAGLQLDPADPDATPVCSEFAIPGISSESLFRIVRDRFGNDKRVAGLFFAGDDQGIEVLNNTLTNGVMSSIAYSLSGSTMLSGWLSTRSANPELRYIDSSANGYGVVRAAADGLRAELITIAPPVADLGLEPAPRAAPRRVRAAPGRNRAPPRRVRGNGGLRHGDLARISHQAGAKRFGFEAVEMA